MKPETFFASQQFVTILSVIITALLSYVVARRTKLSERNIAIAETQLQKIFLPLYLMVQGKKLTEIDYGQLAANMNTKRRKYFLYLSGDFLALSDRLNEGLQRGTVPPSIQKACVTYIRFMYLRLKRALGYPYKLEEHFSYSLLFFSAKYLLYASWCVMLLSMFALAVFGGELYHNYNNIYNALSILWGVTGFISLIALVWFICWEVRYYRLLHR